MKFLTFAFINKSSRREKDEKGYENTVMSLEKTERGDMKRHS